MTAPLHTQLDRLETLLVDPQAAAHLQQTSLALYGQTVPEAWLPQLLADEASLTFSLDFTAPLTEIPTSRQQWEALIQLPYLRPASKKVCEALRAGLNHLEIEDRKRYKRGLWAGLLCLVTPMAIALGGLLGGLFGSHASIPLLLMVSGLSSAFFVCERTVRSTPFFGEPNGNNWRHWLKAAPLSSEHVKKWGAYPEVAQAAVALGKSEVGLLHGDCDWLYSEVDKHDDETKRQVQEAQKVQIQQQALWLTLEQATCATPDESH